MVALLERLRTLAASASAVVVGAFTMATGGAGRGRVALKVGDVAPDFELAASDGQIYHLKTLLDRGDGVVVAWFPKAFTGGCTAECKAIKTSSEALRRFNMRYFAASVDRPDVNARFAESLGLDFPILSDPGKDVARAYGVLASSGYASRWTFYIGGDGRILAIDKAVRPRSHGRDIAARLTEAGL